MSRDTLWQNEGSEKRMFSESDGKPRFKEVSNKIRFATFFSFLELQQKA
jgi:hypothetical protein